jgi:hypothetical protein
MEEYIVMKVYEIFFRIPTSKFQPNYMSINLYEPTCEQVELEPEEDSRLYCFFVQGVLLYTHHYRIIRSPKKQI